MSQESLVQLWDTSCLQRGYNHEAKGYLELGTYGFNPDCKVEIFNMDNFEERLENEGFDEILIPQNEDAKIYPYAFLIEDSILIAMTEEDDNTNEC